MTTKIWITPDTRLPKYQQWYPKESQEFYGVPFDTPDADAFLYLDKLHLQMQQYFDVMKYLLSTGSKVEMPTVPKELAEWLEAQRDDKQSQKDSDPASSTKSIKRRKKVQTESISPSTTKPST